MKYLSRDDRVDPKSLSRTIGLPTTGTLDDPHARYTGLKNGYFP